ncbi:MAG: PQQ-binding-like beta-propeller repeat protein, partial [Planctomycetes bacterium]|nr:PQQ-binding-like beta-propeller repeat protein [Planctomycetota bacterium]
MTISTVTSMVTARGRMFTIEDKATPENPFLPARFHLVARDAFNGIVLWEYPFPKWEPVTRYIKDIAVQLQKRLAVVGEKVYCTSAIDGPVTVFDAATGKVLKVYDGTEETQEIALCDGTLYAIVGDRMNAAQYNIVKDYAGKGINLGGTDEGGPFSGTGFKEGYAREYHDLAQTKCSILAIDTTSGKTLWKEPDITNYIAATLAIQRDRAVYMTEAGLKCLDAKTGEQIWAVKKEITSADGTQANTLVISDNVVYSNEAKKLVTYSLEDGHEKWQSGIKANYEKTVDLFVVGGVAWTGGAGAPTRHDPETGQTTKIIKQVMTGPMGHDRCYRNFITEKYFINSKTGGADFLNLRTGQEFPNHWVRGTCGMGVLPANGMLYAPPWSCQCSMDAMIQNFNALYTEQNLKTPDQMIEVKRKVQLIKGPAYKKIVNSKSKIVNQNDWPVFRKNNARGAATATAIPAKLTEKWKATFTSALSSPIVADDKLFVANVDAHTVYALDVADGDILWSYVAGGRVDSPPTYYKGLILFGSHDGWVYCLSANDGQLAWRFKDLPDKLIGAFGQLESAWPVNASVLVKDDTLYFSAGRSSFLDGGISLYALDPHTGKVKHSRRIYGPFDNENGFPATDNRSDSNPGAGFKTDIMVADSDTLYIRHKAFARDLTDAHNAKPHLIPSAGFLDKTPHHRTYWTVNTRFYVTAVAGIDCDILAIDAGKYYGVQGFPTTRHSYFDPRKSGYRLIAGTIPTTNEQKQAEETKRKTDKKSGNANNNELWSSDLPLTGKAMIKAGDTVCITGTPIGFPDNSWEKYVESYEQRSGGILWLASAKDGTKIAEYKLDAA